MAKVSESRGESVKISRSTYDVSPSIKKEIRGGAKELTPECDPDESHEQFTREGASKWEGRPREGEGDGERGWTEGGVKEGRKK